MYSFYVFYFFSSSDETHKTRLSPCTRGTCAFAHAAHASHAQHRHAYGPPTHGKEENMAYSTLDGIREAIGEIRTAGGGQLISLSLSDGPNLPKIQS